MASSVQQRLKFRHRLLACWFFAVGLLPAQGKVISQADANLWSSVLQSVIGDENFQQGLRALKENRFETALGKFTAAVREHPADPRVRNFRGIALAALGPNAEAAAEYREAIRLDPMMEDAYRN